MSSYNNTNKWSINKRLSLNFFMNCKKKKILQKLTIIYIYWIDPL